MGNTELDIEKLKRLENLRKFLSKNKKVFNLCGICKELGIRYTLLSNFVNKKTKNGYPISLEGHEEKVFDFFKKFGF